jgi:hypothetical protein
MDMGLQVIIPKKKKKKKKKSSDLQLETEEFQHTVVDY